MRTILVAVLSLAMVASAIPVAYVAFQDGSDEAAPGESTTSGTEDHLVPDDPTTEEASSGTDTSASGSGDATDSASADGQPTGSPLLQPTGPGGSPLTMTEDLLGPTPATLPNVSDELSLTEAMQQHPAFPSDASPELTDEVTPWTNALSRIVQAHGILTETMTKAAEGDKDAQELIPYATAQLAEEAERAGPVFDTASTMLDLEANSRLTLYQEGGELPSVGSLEKEVDRLYRLIGVRNLPVETPAENEEELAQLVRATASVVDATRQAEAASFALDASQDRLEMVDAALADGKLTKSEAELIGEVATFVHQATVEPLQARLDALNTLFHVSNDVVPTIAVPTSHGPPHTPEDVPDPSDELPGSPDIPGLPSPAPGVGCVDPLCAIAILDDNDTTIEGRDDPLPVTIPGVGTVDSLFPQRPLLVLDQGGNDTYVDLPRTEGFKDTVNRTGDPAVKESDLPVDGGSTIEQIPEAGPFGPLVDFIKDGAREQYDSTVEGTLAVTDIEPALEAETPVQIVIDQGGADTYTGDEAAAYAAGGGLAAIIDVAGNDVYEVERGIGLIQDRGFAMVQDLAGNDRYTAEDGMGAVLPVEDGFSAAAGGLGALVDHNGNDTYELENTGLGAGSYPTLGASGPVTGDIDRALPLALDLAGPDDEDFNPQVSGFEPSPGYAVEEEDEGAVRVWDERFNTAPTPIFEDPSENEDRIFRVFAGHRTYDADIGQVSNGTVEVSDHNVTVRPSISGCAIFCLRFGLLDGQVHAGIHVQLTGQSDSYEPPHPLILVDAGGSRDRYEDVSPIERLNNATGDGLSALAPILVLDTGGDDTYTGETAHLDTHALSLVSGSGGDDSDGGISIGGQGITATQGGLPIGSAVVVDSSGDDTYTGGNVSSSFLNASADRFGEPYAWQLSTLLYDGAGEDTIEGDIVAGTLLRNASGSPFPDSVIGSSTSNLLLMGTQDTSLEERNDITAGPGSVGGIRLDLDRDEVAEGEGVSWLTKAVVGAAVASPTDYKVGHHSLASVEWCEDLDADTCPVEGTSLESDIGKLAAFFLGSPGRDTYQVETDKGLGDVTYDAGEEQGCDKRYLIVGDSPVAVPHVITRFVEVGGADTYLSGALRSDLPEWRNDAAWEGFSCEDANTATNTTVDRVDAMAIDNLAQYALGQTSETTAGTPVENNENLEPPKLCASPTFGTDGNTLVGFNEARCATRSNADELAGEPGLPATERLALMTETTGTIPLNAYDLVNPCDATENQGFQLLSLEAREENTVSGNPLANGVSGCWATLEIKPTNEPKTPSPIWEPLMPNAGVEDPTDEDNGWLDILAAPINCGFTDRETVGDATDPDDAVGELPLACSTDAFPLPFHVDGTEGFNNGRWLLPDGDYTYRMTFHGPISMALGDDSTLSGELTIHHDPIRHLDEDCDPDDIPGTETEQVLGILTYVECEHEDLANATDETSSVLDGLRLHGVSQRSSGTPDEAVVWSPVNLTQHQDVALLLCHERTPYKGEASAATAEWRQDLGLWATTYDLSIWKDTPEDPQPTACTNIDARRTSLDDGSSVSLALYQLRDGRSPQVIELGNTPLDDTMETDSTDPFVDIGPLTLPTGNDLDTHGLGVSDVQNPEILRELRNLGSDETLDRPIHMELPIQVIDHSPIHDLEAAGVPDHPWTLNEIDDLTFVFDDTSGEETSLGCGDLGEECQARLNLTRAGPIPGTQSLWQRQTNVNFTLDFSDPSADAEKLRDALKRAITTNQPVQLELPEGVEVADEAGNSVKEKLDDLVIDLQSPTDVPLPCNGTGSSVITSETSVEMMTWATTEDIQGFLLQRQVNGSWVTLQWVDLDDTTLSDRYCEADRQGDWRTFLYEPAGPHRPEPGTESLHEIRTVPIDHTGNREEARGPFETLIVFDRQSPNVTIQQTRSEPDQLTVEINATEPVTIEEASLQAEDGTTLEPLRRPSVQESSFTLVFDDLAPNATYDAVVEVVDQAGHTARDDTTVSTARTLNVSLARTPEVVGDAVTLTWTAGALGSLDGGSPTLRVVAQASTDEVCSERRADAFIGAPLDDPETRNITLPLTKCDGGPISFDISIENGPAEAPLEQISLQAKSLHDIEAPTPDLEFSGTRSDTGWFIGPVTLSPTGEDDTGLADASILTAGGPVDQLKLSKSGVHEIRVRTVDDAGRASEEAFRVLVDLRSPDVTLVSQDPLPSEKRLLTVLVRASDDASGLQSMRTQRPNGTWTSWSPVVEDMQTRVDISGLDVLVAEVRDRAGHVARATLPVSNLVEAPDVLDASVQADGPGTVQVNANLDRPMALEARALIDGETRAVATGQETETHSLVLHPLEPGADVEIRVDALLKDGSKVPVEDLTTSLTMPADGGPPTAPTGLNATVLEDGTVELEWEPAQDDAGIQQYLIRRVTDGVLTGQWAQEQTQLIDHPSAGATHTYRIQAVDLDDRTGPWSQERSVTPEIPVSVLNYDITPETATAGEPIRITLTVQAPDTPDEVTLSLGDRDVRMLLEERAGDRFIYSANVTLPSTDTFFPEDLRFHVDDKVFPEQGSLPAPIVKSVADLSTEETDETPGPAIVGLVLSVVSAALVSRRWTS